MGKDEASQRQDDPGSGEPQEVSRLPLVDWPRTAVATTVATLVIGLGVAVLTTWEHDLPAVDVAWALVSLAVLAGSGFWLGWSSQSTTWFGAPFLGAVVGFAVVAMVLNFTSDFSLPGTIALTVTGMLPAGLAGSIAFRKSRERRQATSATTSGAPRAMPPYLFGTGVVSVLLLASMVLYAGVRPLAWPVLVSLAFLPFLLLYPWYRDRLSFAVGPGLSLVLGLWSVLVIVAAVAISVYGVANFPKEEPLQERLTVPIGPRAEQEAWRHLVELSRDRQRGDDVEDVVGFLAINTVSVPPGALTFDSEIPRFVSLGGAGTSGVDEVRELLDQGNQVEAREKYLRLWDAAHNMVSAEGAITLIQHLIGIGMIDVLIEFYLDADNRARLRVDDELLAMSVALDERLDDGYRKAIAAEYGLFRSVVATGAEDVCHFSTIFGVCSLSLPWPFYDRNKTLRVVQDLYLELTRMSTEPYYLIKDEMEGFEQKAERVTRVSALRNPAGSTVLSALIPASFAKFIVRKEESKARLLVLRYVIEASRSGDHSDVPTDPLTGEPFGVADKGDTIEVSSSHREDGERAISYEIRKLSR